MSDAVAALRDELLEAAAKGAGTGLQFEVGPVELSFEVELRKDAKAKAGFKAWVVSADVEAGAGHSRRQRVTLTLTPQAVGGGRVLVGSQAGEEGPGDLSERIEP
ncbi:trypco2 family protein [Nocardia mangyaensis]|uniref:trypco2 family protein n=1 Tax=Nocardia mangyaensis TaxID=2213200 RepID=UPI001F0B25D4|nr:trypco2 family protein [Nocardia mangyaensis]